MARNKIPADPRGGHVRLYWELLDSNAWHCLSATDQRAYVAMCRQIRSTNNGDISLPLSEARAHGITSPATLAKSLRALVAIGLIAITRRGGCTRGGQRLPTLYRLTDREVFEVPVKHIEACRPTNEWRAVKTLAQGRAMIRQANTEKSPLQSLAVTTSKIEAVEASTTSKNEVWMPAPLQKMKHGFNAETASEANDGAAFGERDKIMKPENHTSNIELLSTYYQGVGNSVAPQTAVQRFQQRVGGKLSVPEREPNPLGRTRNVKLFKAAFGHLTAPSSEPTPASCGRWSVVVNGERWTAIGLLPRHAPKSRRVRIFTPAKSGHNHAATAA